MVGGAEGGRCGSAGTKALVWYCVEVPLLNSTIFWAFEGSYRSGRGGLTKFMLMTIELAKFWRGSTKSWVLFGGLDDCRNCLMVSILLN